MQPTTHFENDLGDNAMKSMKNIIIVTACFLLSPWAQAELLHSVVSQDNGSQVTKQAVNNFDVEITAPSSVDASTLLNAIPVDVNSITKIADAIGNASRVFYPEVAISLSVKAAKSKAEGITPSSTNDYVDLYAARYWWNRATNSGGTIFDYNHYVNTVTCYLNVLDGSWTPGYQNNGAWNYFSPQYGAHTMYATGYDNYKGCWWRGESSYNRGNFVLYFFS